MLARILAPMGLFALAVLVGHGEARGAASAARAIAGKVTYQGPGPAPEKVRVSADPRCQQMHPNGLERSLIDITGGGLADAFVWLKGGVVGDYPAPTEPVILDQRGCEYHPQVIGVQAGQPIRILNSDDTLHNIHPRPTNNREFNIGQPRKGMESLRTFESPELMIPVGCDVHPWMRAYVSVVAHPFFAITKADGTYEIKGVPPGEYEVEVYHGQLKSLTRTITVKALQAANADFAFQ